MKMIYYTYKTYRYNLYFDKIYLKITLRDYKTELIM